MKKKKIIDLSDDLYLSRYSSGIKLIRPEKKTNQPGRTLNHFLQLPLSFYLLNSDGLTQKINEEGSKIIGFDSSKHSLGKSLFDVSDKQSANTLIHNCHDVIQSSEMKMFDEFNLRKDGIQQQFLSIKLPWYDQDNTIIGTCGFSIVLGIHSLTHSLSILGSLGLLPSTQLFADQTFQGVHLSKREWECLRFTVKGYTAKKIAYALNISHRTVEDYLTNLKIKMGVNLKSELIEMAMHYFS